MTHHKSETISIERLGSSTVALCQLGFLIASDHKCHKNLAVAASRECWKNCSLVKVPELGNDSKMIFTIIIIHNDNENINKQQEYNFGLKKNQ